MTEEEAKKKWCPFVRYGNEAGCNRNTATTSGLTDCIASDCACWVWDIQMFNPKTVTYLVAGEPYQSTDGAYETYSDRDGHCGLIRG